ncbi:MAG: c-type cytochrome [Rhodospirillaceae bacterium]|jgi:cytochrome c553|nr:c-type cytochrome [Rhodospirillaceae bacterium]MBT4219555.1 c-type cytochrome [Rhodospirillaceae bacterium]MBT4464842.1 c-type cytochrome [Rhodospirillaceae bacterium]MBT5309068.1 c-type cytochrome [Rhodospirillaceae bacterium]MBT6407589.1 c-type cytochrome [Rhodospirillaceae bacterium]
MQISNIKRLIFGTMAVAFVVAMTAGTISPAQAEDDSKIAHGGLLYDKWYGITEGDIPRKTNASYPTTAKKKGKTTWRCKECHGWDYRGVDGAYGDTSNSHHTGLKGIRGAAGMDPAKIVASLKSATHGYTSDMMTDMEFNNLAMFVSKGQVDMSKIIDGKMIKGDKVRGKNLYSTICAGCHGDDGKKIKDMPPLGEVAKANPWETIHKIRNGQPGEKMPALRALPLDVSVDIAAHSQTLPE